MNLQLFKRPGAWVRYCPVQIGGDLMSFNYCDALTQNDWLHQQWIFTPAPFPTNSTELTCVVLEENPDGLIASIDSFPNGTLYDNNGAVIDTMVYSAIQGCYEPSGGPVEVGNQYYVEILGINVTLDNGAMDSCTHDFIDVITGLSTSMTVGLDCDDSDGNAIEVLTTGSKHRGVDISDDVNYTYQHTFNLGTCASPGDLLFVLSGVPGGSLSFDWTGSVITTGSNQSAIEADFSGDMSSAGGGYAFDKEVIHDAAVDDGALTTQTFPPMYDGSEICISAIVYETSAPGNISDPVTCELPVYEVEATYNFPFDVQIPGTTDMIISDGNNSAFRRIYANGIVTTIFEHSTTTQNITSDENDVVNGFETMYYNDPSNDLHDLTISGGGVWSDSDLTTNGSRRELYRDPIRDANSEPILWTSHSANFVNIMHYNGSIWTWNQFTPTAAPGNARGIAVDHLNSSSPTDEMIYVAGSGASFVTFTIIEQTGGDETDPADYDTNYQFTISSGTTPITGSGLVAQFSSPVGLFLVDYDSNDVPIFLICTAVSNVIMQMEANTATPSGAADWDFSIVAGSITGAAGDVDDNGTDARLDSPYKGFWDATNEILYFADQDNHKIKSFDYATGDVETVSGTGSAGFDDTKEF